jgi:hypothetical protein
MKKILLVLTVLIATSAFASFPIFPQLTNFGTSVQLTIFNPNNKDVNCSGMIYMYLIPSAVESQYFYSRVVAHTTLFKTFIPLRQNMTISTVSHSIYCSEIR